MLNLRPKAARDDEPDLTPLIDMVGGGPFNLKPGQWTDDTSMALCLAESLCEMQGFNRNATLTISQR